MNDRERSLLHSIFAVASCSCAAVFALGGVEVVPDGKLHLLCVQPVQNLFNHATFASELTRFSWRGTLPTSFDFYTVADILL